MTPNEDLDLWIKEIHQGSVGLSFKVEKTLFSGQSRYQKVDIVETTAHGRMLLNDGVIMLSQRDEFIYHEMIAHVPLFVHPDPRRVLIIGGGDGGTAREVLAHRNVSEAVMVEIDEMVVQACQTHMPMLGGAWDDPRLELLIQDGVKYVKETDKRFEVVIVDSTDPVGPAEPLFNRDFYANVAKILTEDGILVTQSESPFYDTNIQRPMLENQRPFFNKLHLYLFPTLTYPGGLWSFAFAAKSLCPIKKFNHERAGKANIATRYYNPDIHRSAFMLPNFVKKDLDGVIDTVSFTAPA